MQVKMVLPNDMAALLPVLAFVEELVNSLGLGKRDQMSVRLAMEEAITNVIEHAFEPGENEIFDILFQTDSSKLIIIIKEKGIPFQPGQITGLDTEISETHGLGLRLMKGAMDQITFCNLGREGKELRLVKYLPSSTGSDPRMAGRSGIPGEIHANPVSFEIRLFKPEDAPEISRAAYKTYRYTYDDEFIYYPDQIIELNSRGKILSAVAVSKDGNVIGHAALKFPWANAPIAESGVLMVLPEFRHTRVVFRMLQFLKTRGEAMELEGAYTQAVTSHTISQKAASLFGFKDCAVLLGAFYSGIAYQEIDAETGQKESAVVSYIQLKPRTTRDIYPPYHHLEIIRSIYNSLGLAVNIPETSVTRIESESRLQCTREAITNTAVIAVENYGASVVAEVAGILQELKLDRLDAVYLRLDIENPMTAILADEFEQLGFFFAGIQPYGLAGRDCLILQFLNNLRMECSRVRIHSSAGQELLQYIKSVGNCLV